MYKLWCVQLEVVQSRCRQAVNTKEDLETTISELEKEKKASDKKMNQLQNKITKTMSDFSEEKEVRQIYRPPPPQYI